MNGIIGNSIASSGRYIESYGKSWHFSDNIQILILFGIKLNRAITQSSCKLNYNNLR